MHKLAYFRCLQSHTRIAPGFPLRNVIGFPTDHPHRLVERNVDQARTVQVTDHPYQHRYIHFGNSLEIVHPHHQWQAVNPSDIPVLLFGYESRIPQSEFIKLHLRAEQVFFIPIHPLLLLKRLKTEPEKISVPIPPLLHHGIQFQNPNLYYTSLEAHHSQIS